MNDSNTPSQGEGVISSTEVSPDLASIPPTTPPELTYHYAGFWMRVVAVLIDSSLLFIGGLLLATVFSVSDLSLVHIATKLPFLLPLAALSYFLFSLYLIKKYHATPGKMISGMVIIPDPSVQWTVGRILLRELIGKTVSGSFAGIGYVMVAFTDRKRALHDMVASTTVVYVNEQKKKMGAISGVLSAVITIGLYLGLFSGVIFSSLSFLSKNTPTPPAVDGTVMMTPKESDAPVVVPDSTMPLPPQTQQEPQLEDKRLQEVFPGSGSLEKNTIQDKKIHDYVSESVVLVRSYKEKHTSYSELKAAMMSHYGYGTDCGFKNYNSMTKLDVSPDGKKFVIYQKLCTVPTQSYCFDEVSTEVVTADTSKIEKTYSCR